MCKTSRISTVIFILAALWWLAPIQVIAQPTAVECLENPELEGCPSSETADDSQESPAAEEAESNLSGTSLVWNFLKLIFALVFVVALIYGLLKFFNQKNKLFNQNKTMENLGGMSLGPNRSIQSVRIGEQVFILGVGESVELIAEITDDHTKAVLLKKEEQSTYPASLNLRKWSGKWKGNDRSNNSSSIQFQQLFENQLNDMKQKKKQAMDEKRGPGDE